MSAMTDYLENQLVDHIFRTGTFAKPTGLSVGLFTTSTTDANGGTEVTGGSYARAALNPSDTNWKNTQGNTTGNSSGTGGQTKNAVEITFAAPTADWGVVTHIAIFDQAGNRLLHGALPSPKTINNGDSAPKFLVDSLIITLA